MPASGSSALNWAKICKRLRNTWLMQHCPECSGQLKNDRGLGVLLWGTQASTSPPRTREHFSIRSKVFRWAQGLESRKPIDRLGCRGWLKPAERSLVIEPKAQYGRSIPAETISGKYWLFYPSNNVSNVRKLLKYLCHYLHKMISRVQGKNRYFFLKRTLSLFSCSASVFNRPGRRVSNRKQFFVIWRTKLVMQNFRQKLSQSPFIIKVAYPQRMLREKGEMGS